jgi:hypothetical protein
LFVSGNLEKEIKTSYYKNGQGEHTFFLHLEIRETGRCFSVLNTFASLRDPKVEHRSPTCTHRERSLPPWLFSMGENQ